MILQNLFFKPKWKHRNPAVRRQALIDLDMRGQNAQAVVQEIAQQDTVVELRRLAVKRVNDLSLLGRIQKADQDPSVCSQAQQRFQLLISGDEIGGPPLADRLICVSELQDNNLLEFLVLHGKEAALRKAVLNKVERDSVLGKVAIQDPEPTLRMAALDRVRQHSTLTHILKASRTRDKRISRKARLRLDKEQEEQDRQIVRNKRAKKICITLEAIQQASNWEKDQATTDRVEAQWQTLVLEAEAELAPFQSRYQAALLAAKASILAQRQEEERLIPIRQQLRQLCEKMEQLQNDLQATQPLSPENEQAAYTLIQDTEETYQRQIEQEKMEDSSISNRFQQACTNARSTCKALAQQRNYTQKLITLLDKVETYRKKDRLEERCSKQFTKDHQVLQKEYPSKSKSELDFRFEQSLDALRSSLAQQRENLEHTLAYLAKQINQLEQTLDRGEFKPANSHLYRAQDALKTLNGWSPARTRPLEDRLRKLQPQLREMADWQRWGDTREKGNLCQAAEALLDPSQDPNELAQSVRNLRNQWKQLGRVDKGADRSLWERFDRACNEAYAPCQAHFDQLAKARQGNLAKREVVCERLEAFAKQSDWEAADWKQVQVLVNEARQVWRALGSVNRSDRSGIETRFRYALGALEKYLHNEHNRNAKRKQSLAEQANNLATKAKTQTELGSILEQAKALQVQWKKIGQASRSHDRALWKNFHAACNSIFERREEIRTAHQRSLLANLAEKETLCQQMEKLATYEEPKTLQIEANNLRIAWAAIGPAPKESIPIVEKRWNKAQQEIGNAQQGLQYRKHQQNMEQIRQKAALCQQIESLDSPPNEAQCLSYKKQWSELPNLTKESDRFLNQRLKQACSIQNDPTIRQQQETDRLKKLKNLCLRMEMAVGIESPVEYAQDRLQQQLQQLPGTLGSARSGEKTDLATLVISMERSWHQQGPASQALEARFRKACEAHYKM